MGCVSSKILSKSGSFQEKVVSHGFKRSNLIEEIILSNPKSNGDQFLALLRASNAAKDAADQSTATAAAEQLVKIETINVSELLAGLEEDDDEEEERNGGETSSAQPCVFDAAVGRARSFRTVEEYDALVTQSGSPEQGTPAKQRESSEREVEASAAAAGACSADHQDATSAEQCKPSEQEEAAASGSGGGNKRRARARQLGELKVPTAFDFSKSGSLRDWLLHGGQIFSPGSYVTPKFGTTTAAPQERGVDHAGEPRPQPQQHSVFDPELVAQFEQAMERLSKDEERALEKILEAMGAAAAAEDEVEKEGTARLETPNDRPVMLLQE
ncbi:uncharacterized protein LOC102700732 [Oryza brachyantha]|uniref:uncharacterized protein LOC102700732 n=1 Tax=Oryza brachyantha TaxID=4533 RepID=UPI001AD9849C|nr:uncharacterized protein LOC102700732 [Oryza brachyantha]